MRVTVSPEQIRSAFEAVKDDPSFDESRALWEHGRPPVEMIQAMCLRPEILRAFAGFGGSVYPGGILERRVKELVIITASTTNDCQFCTHSHCDLVSIGGILEAPLELVAQPDDLAPRERLAVEYTRAVMHDSNHIPEALWTEMRGDIHGARDRRDHVPRGLHQHAQPVQQQPGRAVRGRVQHPRRRSGRLGKGAKGPAIPGPVAVVPRRPSRLRWTGATGVFGLARNAGRSVHASTI